MSRRGHGQTTRMIEAAIKHAEDGHRVVIVGATHAHNETAIRRRLAQHLAGKPAHVSERIIVIAERTARIEWALPPHVPGHDGPVLIDHFLAETRARYLERQLEIARQLAAWWES